MRPESQEGCQLSDWFNILVLHQNRLCVSASDNLYICLPHLFQWFLWILLEKRNRNLIFQLNWCLSSYHASWGYILKYEFTFFLLLYDLQSEDKSKKCNKWAFSTKILGLHSVGTWTWMSYWSSGANYAFSPTILNYFVVSYCIVNVFDFEGSSWDGISYHSTWFFSCNIINWWRIKAKACAASRN